MIFPVTRVEYARAESHIEALAKVVESLPEDIRKHIVKLTVERFYGNYPPIITPWMAR